MSSMDRSAIASPATTISDCRALRFNFQNSYVQLPERFYCRLDPTPVAAPALTVIALVGIGVMTVKVIHVHALVGPLAPSLIGFLALMVLAAWKNKTQVYMTVCACVASSTWTMVVMGFWIH